MVIENLQILSIHRVGTLHYLFYRGGLSKTENRHVASYISPCTLIHFSHRLCMLHLALCFAIL